MRVYDHLSQWEENGTHGGYFFVLPWKPASEFVVRNTYVQHFENL